MYSHRYFERYIFGYIKMLSLEIYVLYCFKHTNMLYMIRIGILVIAIILAPQSY